MPAVTLWRGRLAWVTHAQLGASDVLEAAPLNPKSWSEVTVLTALREGSEGERGAGAPW